MKKRSIILQLFIILFVILLCLIVFLGFSTYKYAESVIQKEVIQLNSNMLQQIAIRINQELVDVENLASRIAYDKNIIESLKGGTEEPEIDQDKVKRIEGIMATYIWSYRSTSMLIDAHVVDNHGNIYSTSYSLSSEQMVDFSLYSETAENSEENEVLPIKYHKDAISGYNYYYQVVRKVKDYITEDHYGLLLLNVNEKLLWDNYIRLTNDEKDFTIVDQNGVIISNKDKERINERLDGFVVALDKGNPENYYLEDGKLWIYYKINEYGWYILESLTLESAMMPIERIEYFLITFGLLCIVLTGVALVIVARKISEPLGLLTGKMTEFTEGDISIQIPDSPYKEFSEMSVSFNELIQRVNYLLEENINNERQKRLLELDFLQAQINPHFIYNTLSSIRFYVEMGKNEEAEDMLFHFSKLLRRVLSRADEFVLLRDEIELLDNYLALQRKRYPDVFEVEFSLPEDTLDSQIPSFILQPIIENAIFHGAQGKGPILIRIEAEVVDSDLYLTISDDGIGMSDEKIHEILNKEVQMNSIGIMNVNERIRILYGGTYGLTIEQNEPIGTRIVLKLRRYA